MQHQLPAVRGEIAPHLPAEIYERLPEGGRIIVVPVAQAQRTDWAGHYAALGVVLAAGVGGLGLAVALLAVLDVAAHVAAGIATPAGVTVTASIAGLRRGKS